jgi:nucleosome binding factor SPN SPT16 subunit
LKGCEVELEIVTRSKDEDANVQVLKDVVKQISGNVGMFVKEQPAGKLAGEWKKATEGTDWNITDVSTHVAMVMAAKDEVEIKAIQLASTLTSRTLTNYFVGMVTGVIDNGKKITHEQVTDQMEVMITDERKRSRLKAPEEMNWKLVEWCYPPIIQSGGKYDLKPSAQSDGSTLHAGTIVASFGIRYKSYCSNIGRTILINPEKVIVVDW